MANLTAETKSVKEIFQREYLIPEYQRPYSWEQEECEQLVDDVAFFYKDDKESQYFLGCMVITKGQEENQKDKWLVIDGQQRLTTLLLLIRALHKRAGTYVALEECYKKRDPKTGEFSSEMRLVSEVIEGDKENLAALLLDGATSQNRFSSNFEHISNMLNDKDKMLWEIVSTSDGLDKFIQTLLDRVVLLPIECDVMESALTIFNTLNNRGTPLTDADIFKATLYRKLQPEQKEIFVNDWKVLMTDHMNDGQEQNGDTIVDLFRIYMHVLRAQGQDTTKEKALRAYFLKSARLDKPFDVMDGLKKYKAVDSWESCPTITIWWCILDHTYPNIYWKYPLYVFLDKYGDYNNDRFVLPGHKEEKFVSLIESTVRYCFIKGVVTNTVNSIKDTIFKVCAAIAHEEDYTHNYRENSDSDIEEFYRKLEDNKQSFGRYRNGLILINSALHASLEDDSNRLDYSDCLMKANSISIEHILPRKWNHYDGWNERTHNEDIGKLGNLIPWERKLNSAASNEFFSRKKKEYKKSRIAEVRTLCDLDKWSPESLEQRDREVRKRLKQFFSWGKSKV